MISTYLDRNPRLLVLSVGIIVTAGLSSYCVLPRREDHVLTRRGIGERQFSCARGTSESGSQCRRHRDTVGWPERGGDCQAIACVVRGIGGWFADRRNGTTSHSGALFARGRVSQGASFAGGEFRRGRVSQGAGASLIQIASVELPSPVRQGPEAADAAPTLGRGPVESIFGRCDNPSRQWNVATSLTTIAGFALLVLGGGGFWPPLAIAIAGGVAGATILALYFVPAVYLIMMVQITQKTADELH